MKNKKVVELKQMAKDMGLVGYSKLKKQELIDFIKENLDTKPTINGLEEVTETTTSKTVEEVIEDLKKEKTDNKNLDKANDLMDKITDEKVKKIKEEKEVRINLGNKTNDIDKEKALKKEKFQFFAEDLKEGDKGEETFIQGFLKERHLSYKDVSLDREWQKEDIDLLVENNIKVEIKYNYNDNGLLVIEEYANINEDLGPISTGWIDKSQADVLAVVSRKSAKVLLFNLPSLKIRYEEIKDKYELRRNNISKKGNSSWQSAFRMIELKDLEGLYIEIEL